MELAYILLLVYLNNLDGNNYSGTFLPEVMTENDFTKDDTLKHLIRKAGYN